MVSRSLDRIWKPDSPRPKGGKDSTKMESRSRWQARLSVSRVMQVRSCYEVVAGVATAGDVGRSGGGSGEADEVPTDRLGDIGV